MALNANGGGIPAKNKILAPNQRRCDLGGY